MHSLGDDWCPGSNILSLRLHAQLVIILEDVQYQPETQRVSRCPNGSDRDVRHQAFGNLMASSLVRGTRIIVHATKHMYQSSGAARFLLQQVRQVLHEAYIYAIRSYSSRRLIEHH
jgi:hypothetical protein